MQILSDGTNKSYIIVDDCVSAVMETMKHVDCWVEIYDVGSEGNMNVKDMHIPRSKGHKAGHLHFKFIDKIDGSRGMGW